MIDVKRLSKLLMLATSDNDHEALAAFRKATDILRSSAMTWNDLVAGVPEAQPSQTNAVTRDKLNYLLGLAKEHALTESTERFVRSIATQFVKRGSLSPKQQAALDRIYDSHFVCV